MKIGFLVTMIGVATSAVLGCGGNETGPPAEVFEIDGSWTYLGPSDGPHELVIGPGSMVYTDIAGRWSSKWIIKAYDNGLHHFQVAYDTGSGTYLPTGKSLSGTYELTGPLLTVQVANGLTSYPKLQDPGTCTSAADGAPVPDCRLYIKQN